MRLTMLLLTVSLLALPVGGCMTQRKRLKEERSALLAERDQIQQPWQPQALRPAKNGPPSEAASPSQRLEEIDKRVAELDEQLLQLR